MFHEFRIIKSILVDNLCHFLTIQIHLKNRCKILYQKNAGAVYIRSISLGEVRSKLASCR